MATTRSNPDHDQLRRGVRPRPGPPTITGATRAVDLLHIPGAGEGGHGPGTRHRHGTARPHGRDGDARHRRGRPVGRDGDGERVRPAGTGILTVVVGLALAALLCADSLHGAAERQPFGTGRDLALSVAEPVRDVSHAVGLHLPRLWLAELAGVDEGPSTGGAGADLDVPAATTPAPAKPGAAGTSDPAAGPTPGPSPGPTPTTAPAPGPRRVATAEAPVHVLLAGDSLMGNVSAGFGRLVGADPRVRVEADFRVATGLARPDVLDWPVHLHEQLASSPAEVVYLLLGGNDDQDMSLPDGSRAALGSDAWRAEYARRVALAMDVAAQDGRSVVWVGLPAVAPERLAGASAVMGEVARAEAELRPAVTYVDSGEVLSPGGAFVDAVTGADGAAVDVRESDGVHVTHDGADLLAPSLLAPLRTQFGVG